MPLAVKLLLLRRDLCETRAKRETGVPCLTPAVSQAAARPCWGGQHPLLSPPRGTERDRPRREASGRALPLAGMGLSLWDCVPQGSLSLLTFDFPKGNFPQQSPAQLPHPSGAQARPWLLAGVWMLPLPKDPAGAPHAGALPPASCPESSQHFGPGCRGQHSATLLGQHPCPSSWCTGTGGGFPTPPGRQRVPGPASPKHRGFPRQETAFCSVSLLQQRFAQHVQEDFPAPWSSAQEPFRDRAAPSASPCSRNSNPAFLRPSCFSRRHVPFGSSFRHPDISPFSFLWNFFNFSPCRVLGFGGSGSTPGSGDAAVGEEPGTLSLPGWVWLCWAPGKVSPGVPGAFHGEWRCWKVSPARRALIPCRIWQRRRHPSLKLFQNSLRERNSHELEQL